MKRFYWRNFMNLLLSGLIVIFFVGFFSAAHAQDVLVETPLAMSDVSPAPEIISETTLLSEVIQANENKEIETQAIETLSIETLSIETLSIESLEIETPEIEIQENENQIALPSSPSGKRATALGSGITVTPVSGIVPKFRCTINNTTGVATCPKPVDPCLVSDLVTCQPPVVPEEEITPAPTNEVLFSFNSLWVPGKISLSPSAGTLETTPLAPATLFPEGPDPAIIAKADGRTFLSEEKPLVSSAPSNSITGLFSGTNLPWLGLIFLFVLGIFVWRKRKN